MSNPSRSAKRPDSCTASGCSGKRAAIASGDASTCEVLPRRCGSDSSSVVPSRAATKASCSATRERACAWTLPVATQGTPSRSASSDSRRLRRRSCLREGALQLDSKALRPEGPQ